MTTGSQTEAPILIVRQADGYCAGCNQPGIKGEKGMWVKGVGVFHENCLKPEKRMGSKVDTREAHAALMAGLDAIEASLDTASLERQVEIGSILWELDNRIHDVLEKVKEAVREEAVQRLGGQVGSTVILGEDRGVAGVKILAAELRVSKHVSVNELKRDLGTAFDRFFKEKVNLSPHKDFEELVLGVVDDTQQRVLHDAVERVELTPRVSFHRNRPSK